jgi:UDP-N-acetylglucosamine acyltransferase
MPTVHRTALVDPKASLADDVVVGAYSVIGPQVRLEAGVELGSHVVVEGRTTLGAGTKVHAFACIGTPPQFLGHRPEDDTELSIGRDNIIREYVTINVGTREGGGRTEIGDNGFFMTNAHVAHDCHIGDHVIMANCATLGGHVTIGDFVVIGGLSAVHQRVRIGDHAMIGGMSAILNDVIPYGTAVGNPAHLSGLNIVGLKRRGFRRDAIASLRETYRMLFEPDGKRLFADRLTAASERFGALPEAMRMIGFASAEAERQLCHPSLRHGR